MEGLPEEFDQPGIRGQQRAFETELLREVLAPVIEKSSDVILQAILNRWRRSQAAQLRDDPTVVVARFMPV